MGYEARIVCHSSAQGVPSLMTAVVKYPRIVIAEVVTHRTVCGDPAVCERSTPDDISKNSASSRAISFSRMVRDVMDDPYIPDRFTKNGSGMQGHGHLDGADHERARSAWLRARDYAVEQAWEMYHAGVHKQDVNRLLEPWAWVTQILTADDWGWNNFFALRCHAAAHPAFQRVARMLYLEYRKSVPEFIAFGQWHLPLVTPEQKQDFVWVPSGATITPTLIPDQVQFSAARCAWVSYVNHDKDGTPEKMRSTFEKLMCHVPIHASPVEHQATPMHPDLKYPDHTRSNLRGWIQARKLIARERIDHYEPSDAEVQSWGL